MLRARADRVGPWEKTMPEHVQVLADTAVHRERKKPASSLPSSGAGPSRTRPARRAGLRRCATRAVLAVPVMAEPHHNSARGRPIGGGRLIAGAIGTPMDGFVGRLEPALEAGLLADSRVRARGGASTATFPKRSLLRCDDRRARRRHPCYAPRTFLRGATELEHERPGFTLHSVQVLRAV